MFVIKDRRQKTEDTMSDTVVQSLVRVPNDPQHKTNLEVMKEYLVNHRIKVDLYIKFPDGRTFESMTPEERGKWFDETCAPPLNTAALDFKVSIGKRSYPKYTFITPAKKFPEYKALSEFVRTVLYNLRMKMDNEETMTDLSTWDDKGLAQFRKDNDIDNDLVGNTKRARPSMPNVEYNDLRASAKAAFDAYEPTTDDPVPTSKSSAALAVFAGKFLKLLHVKHQMKVNLSRAITVDDLVRFMMHETDAERRQTLCVSLRTIM